MTPAHQKRMAQIWAMIGVVCAAMISVPFVFDIDMISGGGAFLFVGFAGVISSVLVTVMYLHRARTLHEMSSKENLLVEWDLAKDDGGPTTISLVGMITGGALYTFKGTVCSFKDVKLHLSPPRMEMILNVTASGGGSKSQSLIIAIPEGQVEQAQSAATKLRARYRG